MIHTPDRIRARQRARQWRTAVYDFNATADDLDLDERDKAIAALDRLNVRLGEEAAKDGSTLADDLRSTRPDGGGDR